MPTAFNKIHFRLTGAAVWKGGIAQMEGPSDPAKKDSSNGVLATDLPVELGVNRVLIRATAKAGRVRLDATADGLRSAALDTVSHAIARPVGGLSRVFAGDYQPSDLSRGPTPPTPSFTPFQTAVAVAAITVSILERSDDALLGKTETSRPIVLHTFGSFEDFLVFSACRHASFDSH